MNRLQKRIEREYGAIRKMELEFDSLVERIGSSIEEWERVCFPYENGGFNQKGGALYIGRHQGLNIEYEYTTVEKGDWWGENTIVHHDILIEGGRRGYDTEEIYPILEFLLEEVD